MLRCPFLRVVCSLRTLLELEWHVSSATHVETNYPIKIGSLSDALQILEFCAL